MAAIDAQRSRLASFMSTSKNLALAKTQRGAAIRLATPLRSMSSHALPEEILDHVDDLAGVDVDQQRIIVVADPLRSRRRIGQRVHRRVDPVPRAIIIWLQPVADVERPVSVVERIDVDAEVKHRPVVVAIIAPVVTVVVAPAPVPAAVRPTAALVHALLGASALAEIAVVADRAGPVVGPSRPVARPPPGLP